MKINYDNLINRYSVNIVVWSFSIYIALFIIYAILIFLTSRNDASATFANVLLVYFIFMFIPINSCFALAILLFLLEIPFKFRIKNKFITQNKFYRYFSMTILIILGIILILALYLFITVMFDYP